MQCHMFTCCTAIPPTSLFLSTARVRSMSAVSHNNLADCQSELLPQSRGRQQLRLLVSTPHQLPVAPPPCCRKHLSSPDVTDPNVYIVFSRMSVPQCLLTVGYLFTLLRYCLFLLNLAMTKGAHISDCLQESLDSQSQVH